MLYVPGRLGKDLCDSQLGMTRRDIVRVGATSLFGLNLGQILEMQAHGAAKDLTGGQAGAGSQFVLEIPATISAPQPALSQTLSGRPEPPTEAF